jgi:uncharacterized membrane protein YeaQ/YmgE (transglycosylase-associated protein family)
MSLVAWISLGLVAGFIASKMVDKRGKGPFLDIVLGIAGAVFGGLMFNFVGVEGVTGFDMWSLGVAVIGSVVVLYGYHAATRRPGIRIP